MFDWCAAEGVPMRDRQPFPPLIAPPPAAGRPRSFSHMRRQIPALIRSRLVVAIAAALALSAGAAAPASADGRDGGRQAGQSQDRGDRGRDRGDRCERDQGAPAAQGGDTAGSATGRKIG